MKKYSSLLWLISGALFLFFSGGKYNFWLAAWLPGIFFLRYFRAGKFLPRLLLTIAVTWLITLISWYGIQPLDPVSYSISMLITTIFTMVPLILDRFLHNRVPHFASTLVYPVFATTLEFLFITVNPMGSFGSLAYSQFANLPFIQLLSITGLMGITFIMNWFPAVVNHLWEKKWELRPVPIAALAFLVILLFAYFYGGIRLIENNDIETVKVSAIFKAEGDRTLVSVMSEPEENRFDSADSMMASYLEKSRREALLGSSIICWPEGAVITESHAFAAKENEISGMADSFDIYLVVPYVIIYEDNPFENKVIIYGPEGGTLLEHLKYGGNVFEGSKAGDGFIDSTDTDYGRIASVICWDMDFPEPLQQTGSQGVDILFSPSNEWSEIIPVHGQMAVYRGVENGSSTVHPAASGLSIMADPQGRVLDQANWFLSGKDVVRASLPIEGRTTIYSKIGDIFPKLILISSLILLIYGVIIFIKKKIP